VVEEQIQQLQSVALARIEEAKDRDALEQVRVDVLGRKGSLAQFNVGKLLPQDKAKAGKALNAAKQILASAFETKDQTFAAEALNARLKHEWLDLTLPAPGPRPGSLHPVTIIQNEIEDLFTSLGFAVLDGPEVETEYHNFDALNIPPEHPARDMQDTFWLSNGHLLRTHTSPV
jgi:phenylalanyl-tRNA synthetase alpha chain